MFQLDYNFHKSSAIELQLTIDSGEVFFINEMNVIMKAVHD